MSSARREVADDLRGLKPRAQVEVLREKLRRERSEKLLARAAEREALARAQRAETELRRIITRLRKAEQARPR